MTRFWRTNFRPDVGLRLLLISGFLLLLGGLFVQFIGRSSDPATATVRDQKINLALRRTAHNLLRAAGDSTSRIPPVQQINEQTFRLQLGHAFDYNRLPGLLQASFRVHQVSGPYDVAVLDCVTDELQVGYTVTDLTGKESVPCAGRSLNAGCHVLQVTFTAPLSGSQTASPTPVWPLATLGSLLIGLLAVVWYRAANAPPTVVPAEPALPDTKLLRFGQSSLDLNNQTLTTDEYQHKLTYREAKLLRVLVNHANQVLEREQILRLVWEDEGVTVGRSVDVFVSRLRKLLSHDPSVQIVAVHGVGYRLTIESQ
jgi:hypothetical protein